jgi:hypothetical protein
METSHRVDITTGIRKSSVTVTVCLFIYYVMQSYMFQSQNNSIRLSIKNSYKQGNKV